MSLRDRWLTMRAVAFSTDWQLHAVYRLLGQLRCHQFSVDQLAAVIASRYNPYDSLYGTMLCETLGVARVRYGNLGDCACHFETCCS